MLGWVGWDFQFSLARSGADKVMGLEYAFYLSILSCEISAPVLSDFRLFNPYCGDLVAGEQFF